MSTTVEQHLNMYRMHTEAADQLMAVEERVRLLGDTETAANLASLALSDLLSASVALDEAAEQAKADLLNP